MNHIIHLMIYAGSILMVYNIVRYYGFTRKNEWMKNTLNNRFVLYFPLLLLVLFLIGYLLIGIFGKPDIVVALILFGGSIFVLITLSIMYYIVDTIYEKEGEIREVSEASKAKSEFLSNMSHDLRTPMNAVIGYAQLAGRPGTTEDEMHEYLDKIYSSGNNLLAIIDDVLEMSSIESGKMEIVPVRTDLKNMLCEINDLFESQMERKGINFEINADKLINNIVLCDKNRFVRVILNLVSNAYKFTPEGGTVKVELEQLETEENRGAYRLTVSDTGIGMSREFAAKVFESFERERTSTVSGIQGTGLGMTITKNIVDKMDGKIAVETEKDKGTTFTVDVKFEILENEPGDSKDKGCAGRKKSRNYSGIRLLLAEDNEINMELATMILSDAGFEIDKAENGRVAYEMVAKSEPGFYRAVLMDIQMPEMNGFEATKKIRELSDPDLRNIPVIAMTANVFSEDVAKEKEAGMDAHISKPIIIHEMFSTLDHIFREDESAASDPVGSEI